MNRYDKVARSELTKFHDSGLFQVSYGNKGPIFMGNAILAKRDDLRTGVSDTVTSLKTNIIAYGLTAALCLLLPVAFLSLLLHRRCRQRTKRKRSVKVNNLEVFANNLGIKRRNFAASSRQFNFSLLHFRLRDTRANAECSNHARTFASEKND